jgi:arginyl-tRNA--protein-N-Asp/Glu arginylyltransferase
MKEAINYYIKKGVKINYKMTYSAIDNSIKLSVIIDGNKKYMLPINENSDIISDIGKIVDKKMK